MDDDDGFGCFIITQSGEMRNCLLHPSKHWRPGDVAQISSRIVRASPELQIPFQCYFRYIYMEWWAHSRIRRSILKRFQGSIVCYPNILNEFHHMQLCIHKIFHFLFLFGWMQAPQRMNHSLRGWCQCHYFDVFVVVLLLLLFFLS